MDDDDVFASVVTNDLSSELKSMLKDVVSFLPGIDEIYALAEVLKYDFFEYFSRNLLVFQTC